MNLDAIAEKLYKELHTPWLGDKAVIRAALAQVRDEALRSGWNAAIVLGHNICVQENDRINADDGSVEAMDALSECARRIKDWAEPDDRQLAEMFGESEPALRAMKGKPNGSV